MTRKLATAARRNLRWIGPGGIVERAREIVESYDTAVTLRQLFYRLVSAEIIPNTQAAYGTLSSRTAQARRDGTFPDLLDQGRRILVPETYDGPAEAMRATLDGYGRDRTDGQEWQVWLAVEKNGLVAQLWEWFSERGVPIIALGGYASQTAVDRVRRRVAEDGRRSVLLVGGDLDPSGEDITRSWLERTACWDEVERVALSEEQVDAYGLPRLPGKVTDPRAEGFRAGHGGELFQVELDALAPDVLREVYTVAVDRFWDAFAFERVLVAEDEDRAVLRQAVESVGG